MKIATNLPQACVAVSIGSLLIGYILGGYWLIMPILIILLMVVFLTKNMLSVWPASLFLLCYVFLAVIGVTLNLSTYLMILGCISALAYWDLTNFRQSFVNSSQPALSAPLEKYHLQSLIIAVLVGLVAAFISLNIDLQVSFGVTFVLVLIVMTSLTYGLHFVSKRIR